MIKMDIEGLKKVAKGVKEDTNQHSPQIVYKNHDGTVGTKILIFKNDREKRAELDICRQFIQENQIPEYCVIMDAYIGNDINKRPSEQEDSRHAIFIMHYTKDLTQELYEIPYINDETGQIKEWQEERKVPFNKEESASIWNFYLEDCMDEKIRKAREGYK